MRARSTQEGPRFRIGDRVLMNDRHYVEYWANGSTGNIAMPHTAVQSLAGGWNGHVRMVSTVRGVEPYYWVVLDEPWLDNDGDGPYAEAEIAASSLQLLT